MNTTINRGLPSPHVYNEGLVPLMAKMASERRGSVNIREAQRRLGGDDADEIRRIAAKWDFVDEGEYFINNSMGNANDFRDAIVAMLKQRRG